MHTLHVLRHTFLLHERLFTHPTNELRLPTVYHLVLPALQLPPALVHLAMLHQVLLPPVTPPTRLARVCARAGVAQPVFGQQRPPHERLLARFTRKWAVVGVAYCVGLQAAPRLEGFGAEPAVEGVGVLWTGQVVGVRISIGGVA